MSPSVASAAMLLMNSKNCVACTIEYGMPELGDQLLLDALGLEVALVGHALGADHRQRHVVADARRLLRREQVAGRRLEELEHRRVLERRRVGDVDDDVGALEHLGQALARERVDAGVGRRRDASCPCSPSFATTCEPTRPVPPMTTIFMRNLSVVAVSPPGPDSRGVL